MTRRRPALRIALASVAAFGLIASACGGGTDEGNGGGDKPTSDEDSSLVNAADCPVDSLEKATAPVNITVWHAWLGKTRATLEATADEFNKSQSKVHVSVESQGSYEEMQKKYTDAMATPEALPDLILSQDTTLQFMIDSGTAIPAAACIKADPKSEAIYDDMEPSVISSYSVKDVLWPAAFSVNAPALYINMAHFKAAGLDTTKLPQTLDELHAAAKKIADAKAAGVPELQGVAEPMVLRLDSAWLENWVTGAGVAMVNNDNGRSGLATKSEMDSKEVKDGFTWLKTMTDEKLLKPVPFSNTFGQLFAMALQSSSILIDTATAIPTVDAAISGTLKNEDIGAEDLGIDLSTVKVDTLQIGVGAGPGFKEAGKGQIGGAAWYIVNRDKPESIAAVWEFTKFSNDVAQQVRWTLDGGYLPVRKAARKDKALETELSTTRKGQWLAAVADGITKFDPDKPGPVIGPYNEFRDIYRNALESVTLGGKGLDETLTDSNTKFNDALAAYQKDVGG